MTSFARVLPLTDRGPDHAAIWASYEQRIGEPDTALAGMVPDVLVIAPSRTGSSWLYAVLASEEALFCPADKEARYFCTGWCDHDINWYLRQFAPGGGRVKADISPTYALLPPRAIRRVHRLNPALKIVVMFRDPIARAWSHVKHMARMGEGRFRYSAADAWPPPHDRLAAGLLDDWVVANSSYDDVLARWTAVFPPSQILIGFTETIERDPRGWIAQLLAFAGVVRPPRPFDGVLTARVNVGMTDTIPDDLESMLRVLYRRRTTEFAARLRETHGLTLPPEWRETLTASAETIAIGSHRGRSIGLTEHGFAVEAPAVTATSRPAARFLGDVLRQVDADIDGASAAGNAGTEERVLIDVVWPAVDRSVARMASKLKEDAADDRVTARGRIEQLEQQTSEQAAWIEELESRLVESSWRRWLRSWRR